MILRFLAVMLFIGSGYLSAQCVQADYKFTGNYKDSSGNAYHLINNGAILTADRFNNPNSAIELSNSAYLKSNKSFDYQNKTISIWFMPTNVSGGHQAILAQDAPSLNYGSIALAIRTSGDLFCGQGGNGNVVSSSISNNNWYHVVISQSATELKIYLNGQHVSTTVPSYSTVANSPNSDMIFGADRTAGARFFNGKLDDIQVFDCIYTPTQVDSMNALGFTGVNLELLASSIYPNPTAGNFEINLKSFYKDMSLVLVNMQGQEVLSLRNIKGDKINVLEQGLPNGVYLYRVTDQQKGLLTQGKVVIRR